MKNGIFFIFFFFFFQAEDGIRDVAVTGVQTCALPISVTESPHGRGRVPCGDSVTAGLRLLRQADRSEERRVGKGVDLGGRRIIKKKKKKIKCERNRQKSRL